MCKIKSINIKGFRSFSDKDAFLIKDIKEFNLFIGRNNAGKPNIARLLKKLYILFEKVHRF
ncbi:AAA family ATPase [Bacillus cereus group sp. Bc253]|uniref:AAA family ATPase n=1 Tax=Bacillus cereus group sp. Bc253 TaxID=3018103 RepID=UPI003FA45042